MARSFAATSGFGRLVLEVAIYGGELGDALAALPLAQDLGFEIGPQP